MLKQRIITALILLAVLLGVLFYPSVWAFPLFMTVLVGAASWEWGRLSGFSNKWAMVYAAIAGSGCLFLMLADTRHGNVNALAWLTTCWVILWLFYAIWLLFTGIAAWQKISQHLRLAIGLLTLWMAWLAAVRLHGQQGVWYLLSVMAMAWVADVAAYFSGRAFGRHKLAPRISPGKSWEGAIGGWIGVLIWVFIGARVLRAGNFYSAMVEHAGWSLLLLLATTITILSVLGDLVESLMKRSMDVKDSSNLLPGHGGVLDRVDSLLPVLPMALAATLWMLR